MTCVYIVNSRGALESLSSKKPVHKEIVSKCKFIKKKINITGRKIKFVWLPSHVGISGNERADTLAKIGTQKESIDINNHIVTSSQIKTKIRTIQNREQKIRINTLCQR